MRKLVALLAMCFSLPVAAETFDLLPGRCGDGADGSCFVYRTNSDAWYMNWRTGSPYPTPLISLQRYNVIETALVPVGTPYSETAIGPDGAVNIALLDAAGNVVILTMSTTRQRTCVRVGRGQHCNNWLVIQGGTIAQ